MKQNIKDNKDMTRTGIMACMAVCLLAGVSCKDKTVPQADADWSHADTVVYDSENGLFLEREAAFDSVWYVKLETDGESLLGRPDIVLFADSTIVVADRTSAKAVLMFGYDGKYLGRISRLGNGPGEFLMLAHACIDNNGHIVIFDEMRRKMMRFTERGKLLGELDCSLMGNAFEFLDNGQTVFDIGLRYPVDGLYGNMQFVQKDSLFGDCCQFGKTDFPPGFNFTRRHNLYSFGGKVYGNVNFEDVIYCFEPEGIEARYLLEIKPENASDHFPFENKEELKELYRKYSYFAGDFIELSDYSYFGISVADFETQMPDLLYSHRTGLSHILLDRFNDPMMAFFKFPVARYGDNCLVCCSSANEVLSAYQEFQNRDAAISCPADLVRDLDYESNPVLFFYRLAY